MGSATGRLRGVNVKRLQCDLNANRRSSPSRYAVPCSISWRFPLIRDTSECARYFSAGTRSQSTSGGRIHSEECRLWINGQSICSACRAVVPRLCPAHLAGKDLADCARMQRGKSNVNKISRCTLAQGKTQLTGLPPRTLCSVLRSAKRTGPPVPSRTVLIPFLSTVYSVVQFRNPVDKSGGTLRASSSAPSNALLHRGWIRCVSIHFALRSCSV